MARKYVLVMAVLLLLPGVARADWLFTPYGGMTFGKDAKDLEHFNWGVNAGWMGHGIVGGQTGGGIRPYVSGGFGLLKQNVPGSNEFLTVSRNDWGMNVGVGAQVFASDHVGFRGDVRYLRSLQNDEGTPNDFALGNFDFWRWTAGVTFR